MNKAKSRQSSRHKSYYSEQFLKTEANKKRRAKREKLRSESPKLQDTVPQGRDPRGQGRKKAQRALARAKKNIAKGIPRPDPRGSNLQKGPVLKGAPVKDARAVRAAMEVAVQD